MPLSRKFLEALNTEIVDAMEQQFSSSLRDAIDRRRHLLDPQHESALRLFNGFTEGCPEIVVDVYGRTAVFHNYADPPEHAASVLLLALEAVGSELAWLEAGLVKTRNSHDTRQRRGVLAFGNTLATKIQEDGLWYSIDLVLHRDCSFYLDTRGLRQWARRSLRGKTALNAFAYTGSLGIAALGGGARRVVHVDRTQRFLDIARASYALNGFTVRTDDFLRADFFREAGRLRREKQTFGCVFLDPPFFAAGTAGIVDQENQSARLINKVRPLVEHGGVLVAVNNALYVSGDAYMQELESLCGHGHLEILDLIPVPPDFAGLLPRSNAVWITDPAPFNHPTKIAVLRVR